jgi:2-dehydro-3-deoxygluconokinase
MGNEAGRAGGNGPDRRAQVVAIGECMVELARGSDGRFALAYGGDTFNTSVYLARCHVPVSYVSALGDDPYSAAILDLAGREGVDTTHVARKAGRMPGLYLIETSATGERSFHYWRDRSPAREVFDDAPGAELVQALAAASVVYLSGITLSLYGEAGRARLEATLAAARRAGARIAFDGNYRPRGWGGDAAGARGSFARMLALTDIALPTFDDEQALWGDADPAATIARLRALGVGEIAVKIGPQGVVVAAGGGGATTHVPVPAPVVAIDTTAAGDSFNAAYLARRLAGVAPAEAALAGHRLAGVVIRHRGAIVPHEATAGVV